MIFDGEGHLFFLQILSFLASILCGHAVFDFSLRDFLSEVFSFI